MSSPPHTHQTFTPIQEIQEIKETDAKQKAQVRRLQYVPYKQPWSRVAQQLHMSNPQIESIRKAQGRVHDGKGTKTWKDHLAQNSKLLKTATNALVPILLELYKVPR